MIDVCVTVWELSVHERTLMSFSLVAGAVARTRRTTVVPARWHPDNSPSEKSGQVVRILHIVDWDWMWSFSPRSRDCGHILLEDLEKASDDDSPEPTLRSLKRKHRDLRLEVGFGSTCTAHSC